MVSNQFPENFQKAISDLEKTTGIFQKSAALEKVSDAAIAAFKNLNDSKSDNIYKYNIITEMRNILGSRTLIQKIFDRLFSAGANKLQSTVSEFQSRESSSNFHDLLVERVQTNLTEEFMSDKNQLGFRIAPNMNLIKAHYQGLEASQSSFAFQSIYKDFKGFTLSPIEKIEFTDEQKKINVKTDALLLKASIISINLDKAGALIDYGYINDGNQIIKETSNMVIDQIKSLETNDFMLLPGGTKAHAVVYKIKKDSNNSYSVEVFNTALNSNVQLTLGESTFVKTRSFKLKNCSKDEISDPAFIEKILECSCKPIARRMSDVYKLLSAFPAWKNGTITKGDKYEIQRRGSCTFLSVMAALSGSLPKGYYLQFKNDMLNRAAQRVKKVFKNNIDEMMNYANATLKKHTEYFNKKIAKWTSPEYLITKAAKACIYTAARQDKVEQHLNYIKHHFSKLEIKAD